MHSTQLSRVAAWTLTALAVGFLAFDGLIKWLRIEPVLRSFVELGYPAGLERALGTLELACLALHLVPRTSVLGALALTGYLGGAVATHVRAENPLATHALFPVYVATLLWAGLWLREERLRALIPLRHAARGNP